ncbi:MAG: flavodoxin family protein [Candidatus Ranarchaeia archaeon]|jgi:hypothetical protein
MFDPKRIIIVGVSGSADPLGGTVEAVNLVLKGAKEESTSKIKIETHFINIPKYDIKWCLHCDKCKDPTLKERTGYWCAHQDDMEKWYDLLLDCDGYLFGTANQIRSISPHLKVWADRLRPIYDGFGATPKASLVIAVKDFEDTGLQNSFKAIERMAGGGMKPSNALWMTANLIVKRVHFFMSDKWDKETRSFPPDTIDGLMQLGRLLVWNVKFVREAFQKLDIDPTLPIYISSPIYDFEESQKEIIDAEDLAEKELAKKNRRSKP